MATFASRTRLAKDDASNPEVVVHWSFRVGSCVEAGAKRILPSPRRRWRPRARGFGGLVAVLSALLALFVAGTAKGAGAYGEEPPHTETLLQGRARAGYQGPYLLVALLLERGGPEWVHIRSPSAGSWIRPRNTPALSALEAVGII